MRLEGLAPALLAQVKNISAGNAADTKVLKKFSKSKTPLERTIAQKLLLDPDPTSAKFHPAVFRALLESNSARISSRSLTPINFPKSQSPEPSGIEMLMGMKFEDFGSDRPIELQAPRVALDDNGQPQLYVDPQYWQLPCVEQNAYVHSALIAYGIVRPRIEGLDIDPKDFSYRYFPIINRYIPIFKSDDDRVMTARDSTQLFLRLIRDLQSDIRHENKHIMHIGSYHGALTTMLARALSDYSEFAEKFGRKQSEMVFYDINENAKNNTLFTLATDRKKNSLLDVRDIRGYVSDLHAASMGSMSRKKYDHIFFNNPIFKLNKKNHNSSLCGTGNLIQETLRIIRRYLAPDGEAYMLVAKADIDQLQANLATKYKRLKSKDKAEYLQKYQGKYLTPKDFEALVNLENKEAQKELVESTLPETDCFGNSWKADYECDLKLDFPEKYQVKGTKEPAIYQIVKITKVKR